MGRKEPDYVGFQFYDGKKKELFYKITKAITWVTSKKKKYQHKREPRVQSRRGPR